MNYYNDYLSKFSVAMENVAATITKNTATDTDTTISTIVSAIRECKTNNKKIIIIGNGGSAAIASHVAIDFWKNGGVRATAFNDSSLLTCISNDFCYEEVFVKPIERFADAGDIVFAISSSGKSANITNAVTAAKEAGCTTVTMSGFGEDNPLRSMGDYNFYIKDGGYGVVEIGHLFLMHTIADKYIAQYVTKTLTESAEASFV